MRNLLVLITLLSLSFCTKSGPANGLNEDVAKLLEREGVENPTATGYRIFSCSEDDIFKTGFSGTKNGEPVTGAVCSGWFKNYTVRWD